MMTDKVIVRPTKATEESSSTDRQNRRNRRTETNKKPPTLTNTAQKQNQENKFIFVRFSLWPGLA